MRRVLVPLDGTDLAESILPDAIRLAGEHGELVIVRDASFASHEHRHGLRQERRVIEESEAYIHEVIQQVKAQGLKARGQTFVMGTAVHAIEAAIRVYEPDMVACATHARHGLSRLLLGSIAWQAAAHSTVPVLLRHPSLPADEAGSGSIPEAGPNCRRILVPLDGSPRAEKALGLARALAAEWGGRLYLAHVVSNVPLPLLLGAGVPQYSHRSTAEGVREAESYLRGVVRGLPGAIYSGVFVGPPVDTLVNLIATWSITDVVMASHGRTGLDRLFMGSVTESILQRVSCPVTVVPALAPITPIAVSSDESAEARERIGMS